MIPSKSANQRSLRRKDYHWLFYMNLPLTVIVIGVIGLFMNLKTPSVTEKEKLGQMYSYVPPTLLGVPFSPAHRLSNNPHRIGKLIFIPSIIHVPPAGSEACINQVSY